MAEPVSQMSCVIECLCVYCTLGVVCKLLYWVTTELAAMLLWYPATRSAVLQSTQWNVNQLSRCSGGERSAVCWSHRVWPRDPRDLRGPRALSVMSGASRSTPDTTVNFSRWGPRWWWWSHWSQFFPASVRGTASARWTGTFGLCTAATISATAIALSSIWQSKHSHSTPLPFQDNSFTRLVFLEWCCTLPYLTILEIIFTQDSQTAIQSSPRQNKNPPDKCWNKNSASHSRDSSHHS